MRLLSTRPTAKMAPRSFRGAQGPRPQRRSPFGRMALQAMAAALIALLFLPAFGPRLDHHFAECRPDHAHVYLGELD